MPTYTITHYALRLVRESQHQYPVKCVSNDEHAAALFLPILTDLPHEEIWVAGVNAHTEIVGVARVGMGSIDSCSITCGDVLRPALAMNARAIVLAHNHPSGDPTPSAPDIDFTIRLMLACRILGLDLFDHVVVGRDACRSAMSAIVPSVLEEALKPFGV